jgi:hypothetical protein
MRMSQLLIGIVLLVVSLGLLFVCSARGAKRAWFVGVPLLEPSASIVLVTALMLGVLLIAGYFSAIDEMSMLIGGKL